MVSDCDSTINSPARGSVVERCISSDFGVCGLGEGASLSINSFRPCRDYPNNHYAIKTRLKDGFQKVPSIFMKTILGFS